MRRIYCEATSRELVLPDTLERIVSLSPAVTETLFMLGLGDKVVGVSAFDVHPPEARRKAILGSYSTTNMDKLRSLEPQVIFLTSGYQRTLALRLSDTYPTYMVELPVSVYSIVDMVVKVGLVVNEPESSRALAKTMLQVAAKQLRVGGDEPTVYVEADLGGPVTFGAYSYITDALSLVGARNVFGGHPYEWSTPSFDDVVRLNPQIIIYEPKMFRNTTRPEVVQKLVERGWSHVDAVRNGQVYVTPAPYDFLAHHGPSFVLEALPWLRELVGRQAST